MKTWIAKWRDGTISIVGAKDKTEAFHMLDVEGSPTYAEVYEITTKSFHIMTDAKQKGWHLPPEINFRLGEETSKRKIKF